MWGSWIGKKNATYRKKNTTYVMYIAKLKDGSNRVKKIQNNLEGLTWKGREKMDSR
jgi:hypothetical protein